MRMPVWGVFALSVGFAGICRAQMAPTVTFQSKPIRYSAAEEPYYSGRTPMVPLKATCAKIGAVVKWNKVGDSWTAIRDRDRIEYVSGNTWYLFNGGRKDLECVPEVHGKIVFVPLALAQTISGGALEMSPNLGAGRSVDIYFHDKLLRFRPAESPFWIGGTEYVSMRPMAGYLGARVDRSKDGIRLTVTRSRDQVVYDLGQRSFIFNGAHRGLRGESLVHGKALFVPIEMFQAFVGNELHGQ